VHSAKRAPRLAVLALCGVLAACSLAGCETTQEKAAAQQAESARILEARAKRQEEKKKNRHQNKHEKGKG
jgi:regulator of protease activity HflC (stomatin/prohibitin superfamily)